MVSRTDHTPLAAGSVPPSLTAEQVVAVRAIVDERVLRILARYEAGLIAKATTAIEAMIDKKIAVNVRRQNQRDGDDWRNGIDGIDPDDE